MTRRNALNFVGISVAIGLLFLASCAQVNDPVSSTNSGAANIGSSPSPVEPQQRFDANAPVDSGQSQALTNYLHTHQLPLVGGRVLASNGGSRQVILYGYVATPFGKADAADKSRQFLNDSGAQVENRIKVEPDLAANPNGNPPAIASAPDENNPDIQNYENQQNEQLTQQQQQYLNQGGMGGMGSMGGSGLMMIIPFLLGGSMGGSSFGFGGGMGSPYGYGSPYGGYPPGYGYPGPSPGYGYGPYGP